MRPSYESQVLAYHCHKRLTQLAPALGLTLKTSEKELFEDIHRFDLTSPYGGFSGACNRIAFRRAGQGITVSVESSRLLLELRHSTRSQDFHRNLQEMDRCLDFFMRECAAYLIYEVLKESPR